MAQMDGAFMAQMDGAVSYCFWEICSKKYWSSGEYPSGPRMTTGFGPFELPTRGLLQTCWCFSSSMVLIQFSEGICM